MGDTIYRAVVLIAIIVLANGFKNLGIFSKEEDFDTLSRLIFNITLPCALIVNLNGLNFPISMLSISLLGFICNWCYIFLSKYLGKTPEEQSFMALNMNGYNIGNFSLPFISFFFSDLAVLSVVLFDAGSSLMVLGGNYTMASRFKYSVSEFDPKAILRSMLKSPPMIVYLVMIPLSLLSVELPTIIVDTAAIIGSANTFLAMFLIGLALNLKINPFKFTIILKTLAGRYIMAALIAMMIFYLLPFTLEIRQSLAILSFAPVAGLAPMFTKLLGSNVEFAALANSLSIVISLIIMSSLLIYWQV